ncbi:MAG: hypothetical protein RBR15_02945 [Sphaerochaeta sp.]|nr:hypothetical protein [Sphaerochaeta sp.]
MRTNTVIDDHLIDEALAVSGDTAKNRLIGRQSWRNGDRHLIGADTSVWIGYVTPQTTILASELEQRGAGTGNLILVGFLQGFRNEKQFQDAKEIIVWLCRKRHSYQSSTKLSFL